MAVQGLPASDARLFGFVPRIIADDFQDSSRTSMLSLDWSSVSSDAMPSPSRTPSRARIFNVLSMFSAMCLRVS